MRGVNHRGVVNGGEVSVHQLKVVHAQQSRPDGFDLHVGKVLPDAAMAAWGEDKGGKAEIGRFMCLSFQYTTERVYHVDWEY